MALTDILYLLPYLASLGLSAGILIYAWRHRHFAGGNVYVWFVAGQTLTILGFILELTTPNLESKVVWDKVQWFTSEIFVIAFPIFAIQFTEFKLAKPNLFLLLLFAFPLVFDVLVLTDPLHHLLYPDPHLTTDVPFPDLNYTLTLPVYLFAAYVYLVAFAGVIILVVRLLRPQRLFGSQLVIVTVGFLIPVVFTILALLNLKLTPQRDATPFTFAIGNLVVAVGLFRYRLLDMVPLGRDTVIENLSNPVVVMDMQDRIVDLNPATTAALGIASSDAIGLPMNQVFAAWEDLVTRFQGLSELRTEISAPVNGITRHFELQISLVRNRRGQALGRAFTANDITERIDLQNTLQQLNQGLEKRVHDRTQDVVDAYDTTLEGWAKALELRDKETEGHSRRVTEMTERLARAAGIVDADLIQLRRGALLHDIGKLVLPDEILHKSGPLDDQEFEIVKQHPAIAFELLSPIRYLEKAIEIPYCHHEKWDGSGYPRGLQGDQIPLSARIFAIVDVWDALRSDRPYRNAWSKEQTMEHLRAQSGKQFDPALVELFLELICVEDDATS